MINKYSNSWCSNDNRNLYNGLLLVMKKHCCTLWFHSSSVSSYTWQVVEMDIIVTLVYCDGVLTDRYRQTQ